MSISRLSATPIAGSASANLAQVPEHRHPPAVKMAFNVGVAGHRDLPPASRAAIAATVRKVLASVKRATCDLPERPEIGLVKFSAAEPVRLRIISPLAAGADQIVAEVGLEPELAYELHCPLPFAQADYEKSFHDCPQSDLDRFRSLLGQAKKVLQLDGEYDRAPDSAYLSAGRAVLTHSDLLIAILDPKHKQGASGTAQIVREALSRQIPVLWINPAKVNEVGWYAETYEGTPERKPCGDFAGPQEGQCLRDVIVRAFTPPAPAESEGHGKKEIPPGELLGRYFQEHRVEHRSNFVRRLSRLWKSFFHYLSPPVGAGKFHAPGGPAMKHYHIADELARHYGNMYRSSFLANYLLGATAVTVAMLNPVFANWGREIAATGCTVLELFALGLIWVNFHSAGRIRWHDRFTDYRMLAEQLRHLEFVMPLGIAPSARAYGHDPDRPSEHWTTWHVRNVIREIGIVAGDLNDHDYRGKLETSIRENWIKDQADYHRGNAKRCAKLEHTLHWFAVGLFLLRWLPARCILRCLS